MPLKIELKPGERLIVGNALITNDKERVKLFIEGNVPILREKYVLTEKEADTPCWCVHVCACACVHLFTCVGVCILTTRDAALGQPGQQWCEWEESRS